MVIELDGGIHQGNEQKENDAKRDMALKEMGLRIVRFKNEEVEENLAVVLERIRRLILE